MLFQVLELRLHAPNRCPTNSTASSTSTAPFRTAQKSGPTPRPRQSRPSRQHTCLQASAGENRVLADEAVNVHVVRLDDAVAPVLALLVHGRRFLDYSKQRHHNRTSGHREPRTSVLAPLPHALPQHALPQHVRPHQDPAPLHLDTYTPTKACSPRPSTTPNRRRSSKGSWRPPHRGRQDDGPPRMPCSCAASLHLLPHSPLRFHRTLLLLHHLPR